MPTPEEIKNICTEYVDELFAYDDMSELETIEDKNDAFVMCMAFAGHILEKYCIVSKSLLKEHYEDVCEDIRDYDGKGKFGIGCADMTMYQRARGMKQMLYRLFGKSLFNEEKQVTQEK